MHFHVSRAVLNVGSAPVISGSCPIASAPSRMLRNSTTSRLCGAGCIAGRHVKAACPIHFPVPCITCPVKTLHQLSADRLTNKLYCTQRMMYYLVVLVVVFVVKVLQAEGGEEKERREGWRGREREGGREGESICSK